MSKGILGVLYFAVGGTVGFLAANKLMKQKYERLVQNEVDSVKAAFRKEHPLPVRKARDSSEKERQSYSRRISGLGYTQEEKPAPKLKPRVISPDEFGSLDDYDEISLTYYADKTLTDDSDRPMSEDEIEETVGKESLTHFGEYEDDSVFVRNDRLKADYEILLDQRTYGDILKEKPYLKL